MRRILLGLIVFTVALGLTAPAALAADAPKTDGAVAAAAAAQPAPKPAPANDNKTLTALGNMFQFYGFLRLDISYDTSRVNNGNWAMFVLPNKSFDRTLAGGGIERVNYGNDSEISISPRLSRFGFNFDSGTVQMLGDAKLTGQLEFDFYGGDVNSGDWKAIPRWRQAWLALTWDWAQIKAGQMSDIVSPMFPRIDYNSGSWMMGNVGARRPALQLTFNPKLNDAGHRLYIQGSLARPGAVDGYDLDVTDTVNNGVRESTGFSGDGNADGEDSGIPMIMWRIAYTGALWTKKPFTIGASGHWERYQMRYNRWDAGSQIFNKDTHHYVGYSVNAELNMPILDWWELRGEFYWGENTADIFGGVFQGVNKEGSFDAAGNFIGIKGVKSMGFWVDTTIHYFPVWALTLGYMADMPDEDTLPSVKVASIEASRYKNQSIYINNEFHLGKGFSIGLEFLHQMTEYHYVQDLSAPELQVDSYNAMNERVRTYFMYKF